MQLRLLTIPFSHYCEKARWALDLSGLPYVEEKHAPMFHYAYHRYYGAGPTVPALVTDQGVLSDSSDILEFVYRHGVNLYPRSHAAEVHSWEDRFDESLGPWSRVWAYANILPHPELLPQLLGTCPLHEQRLAKPFFGFFATQLRRIYGVRPGQDQKALGEITAIWDQTDRLLRDGRAYLVGETFSAADLALGALGGPLVLPPEYGFSFPPLEDLPEKMQERIRQFRETPTGKHILRIYRRHRHINKPSARAAG
ncbi:MAG TPA: glutathione S-transferase family protein [Candidatus Obscuribacterales bacterium]